MTSMAVSNNFIAIAKGHIINYYDYSNHNIIELPNKLNLQKEYIADIVISYDDKYLAVITAPSKQLIVYDLPISEKCKIFKLPRSGSKIRFTANNSHILVADKSGDALIYDIATEDTGTKLLGHLSLLLDILQTSDSKFVITSDRDEKIRVSCYPNTYNIHTYCLGHREFVNHIELLPHNTKYLTSTSGDGTIKVWDYENGKSCYTIDTYLDVDDPKLKDNFIKKMDEDAIEVSTLPIVHFSIKRITNTSSLLAVAIHTYTMLLVYRLNTDGSQFSHKLEGKLSMERFPTAVTFHDSGLFTYDDVENKVNVFKIPHNKEKNYILSEKIIQFDDKMNDTFVKESTFDCIKGLYKRKFDNVQEYQERKKQRLEKALL